jgi:hypothetical protein
VGEAQPNCFIYALYYKPFTQSLFIILYLMLTTRRRRHLKCKIHTLAASTAGEIDPESAETGALFSLKLPLLVLLLRARASSQKHQVIARTLFSICSLKFLLSAAESPITIPCLEHSQSPNGKEAYNKQFKSQRS